MKKDNKKVKKVNLKQSPEHRFGVLLEDMDSKLDLIAEGHQMLDKKIDKVDSKVDGLKYEMNQKFDIVNQKFDMVFDELHLIRNELKEKVSREEFLVLEKRVIALERGKSRR